VTHQELLSFKILAIFFPAAAAAGITKHITAAAVTTEIP
jgi:hypothetical protein